MAKFQIFKSPKNNQFYFHLRATGNGEIILQSEGYTTKTACAEGIASVKTHAPFDHYYKKGTSTDGKYYFVLTSSNGKTIGMSQMYFTAAGRDQGIEVVKREAPTATVEELS